MSICRGSCVEGIGGPKRNEIMCSMDIWIDVDEMVFAFLSGGMYIFVFFFCFCFFEWCGTSEWGENRMDGWKDRMGGCSVECRDEWLQSFDGQIDGRKDGDRRPLHDDAEAAGATW